MVRSVGSLLSVVVAAPSSSTDLEHDMSITVVASTANADTYRFLGMVTPWIVGLSGIVQLVLAPR
jgi:hypothetical protein